jgi:hypothetical protein
MDETVITKADILEDLDFIKNHSKNKDSLYTTTTYYAELDAKDVLDTALENEYQNMYEDWYEAIWNDVTEEDIKDIQVILDRILARNKERNTCYLSEEKVEFDL